MADEQPDINLDLIQMVQRARMQNDANATPSDVSAVYWIEAKAPNAAPTPRAGKWIIRTTVDQVDRLWQTIKAATEAGQLGYKAKVSTSPGKDQAKSDARLIHVRVADSDNTAEVERVREALRGLGIDSDMMTYQPD